MNTRNAKLVELNIKLKDKFLAMAKDYQPAADDFEVFLYQLQMHATGKNPQYWIELE